MVHYADETDLLEKLRGQETPDSTTLELGMTEADRTINNRIDKDSITGTMPDELVGIGTLLSAAYILDQLHPTAKERDVAAVQWEKRALSDLDSYLNKNPTSDERNKTRIRVFGIGTKTQYNTLMDIEEDDIGDL